MTHDSKTDAGAVLLSRLDERISAYDRLLGERHWNPSRSHIETARNLMEDVVAALRAPAHSSDAVTEGLRQALEALLSCEKDKARHSGLSDCTCIGWSRATEQAYEMGECPHQKARAALAALAPTPAAGSAEQPSAPFYGAQCPSYPACNGGCGLGCTHEIERARGASSHSSANRGGEA